MNRLRGLTTGALFGTVLVGVFAWEGAWAAPAINPDSGPIGITVTITGEGFGKFVSTRDNAVLFGKSKAPGLVEHWENARIVVRVPRKAVTGPVVVKSAPRPKTVGTFTVEVPTVKEVSPPTAVPGQIVQIVGKNFGPTMGQKDSEMQIGVNEVLFNGIAAEVVRWRDTRIEAKVPSNATTGPLLVRLASVDPLPDGSCCAPVGYSTSAPVTFTVMSPITLEPTEGPLGNPVVISGIGFGQRKPGEDQGLFNGIPAPILQWTDRVIDVWVPISAKSGPLVVRRGAGTAKPDGSCCAERGFASVEAGLFALAVPKVASIAPETAEIGSLITIKGSGFGEFIKSDERTQDNLSREGHQHLFTQFGVNIARSAVLFPANKEFVKASHVAGYVENWTDTEIKVRVPQVAVPGKVLITRGSWDMLPDGTCCKDKEWMQFEAGRFTPTGLDKITADYLKNIPNLGSEQ